MGMGSDEAKAAFSLMSNGGYAGLLVRAEVHGNALLGEKMRADQSLWLHFDGAHSDGLPKVWGDTVTVLKIRLRGMKQGCSQLRVPHPPPPSFETVKSLPAKSGFKSRSPCHGWVRNEALHMPVAFALAKDNQQLSLQLFHTANRLICAMLLQYSTVEIQLRSAFSGDWLARKGVTGTKGASSTHPYDPCHVLTIEAKEDAPNKHKVEWLSTLDDCKTFTEFKDKDIYPSSDDLQPGKYLVWTTRAFLHCVSLCFPRSNDRAALSDF